MVPLEKNAHWILFTPLIQVLNDEGGLRIGAGSLIRRANIKMKQNVFPFSIKMANFWVQHTLEKMWGAMLWYITMGGDGAW